METMRGRGAMETTGGNPRVTEVPKTLTHCAVRSGRRPEAGEPGVLWASLLRYLIYTEKQSSSWEPEAPPCAHGTPAPGQGPAQQACERLLPAEQSRKAAA